MSKKNNVIYLDRNQELLSSYEKDHHDEIRIVHRNLVNRILSVAGKKPLSADVLSIQGEVLVKKDTKISEEILHKIPLKSVDGIQVTEKNINLKIEKFVRNALQQMYFSENVYQDRCEKVSKKETIQSEIMFPDFVEKILDNDLDRQLVLVSILFKNQMRDIDNTVMVSQELIEEDKEASHAGIQKIITENKLKKGKQHGDEGIEYSFPKSWSEKKWRDVQNKWNHFEKRLEVLDGAVDWNSSALYVLLFSRFESNIEYLFDAYLVENPDSIEYGKEFSIKDLKEYSEISEVEDFVHQEKLYKVMHLSHEGRFKWMKNNLNFELDEIERKLFSELYEIRNGIVHGNSRDYRDQIKKLFKILQQHPELIRYLPDDFNSAFLEGKEDSLFFSRKQQIRITLFVVCFTFLCIVGFKMILAFWTKINKKYESDHVYIFNAHIYSLFNSDKNPHISAILFENLVESNLNKHHSDEIDSLLSYSQSLKESKNDKYLIILDKIDWSALSENYKLIKYGILDDVESVINFMKDLSKNDSMKFFRDKVLTKDILLGSFFGGIKEDPKFLKAYEETFEETI